MALLDRRLIALARLALHTHARTHARTHTRTHARTRLPARALTHFHPLPDLVPPHHYTTLYARCQRHALARTHTHTHTDATRVVDEDPPRLPEDRFSEKARGFIAQCLTKRVEDRCLCVRVGVSVCLHVSACLCHCACPCVSCACSFVSLPLSVPVYTRPAAGLSSLDKLSQAKCYRYRGTCLCRQRM